MKRWLLRLLWISLALFASLIIFVLAVWCKPEAFLPLDWIRGQVVKRKIVDELEWKSLALHTEMKSFFAKRVRLDGSAICLHLNGSTEVKGCIDDIHVDVDLNLNPWHFKLETIRLAQILSDKKISVISKPETAPAPEKTPAVPLNLRTLYVDNFALINRSLFFDVPHVEARIAEFQYQSDGIDVSASLGAQSKDGKVDLKAHASGTISEQKLDAHIEIDQSTPKRIGLRGKVQWQKNLDGDLLIDLEPDHFRVRATAQGPLFPSMLSQPLHADIDLQPESIDLAAGGSTRVTVVPHRVQIRDINCRAQANFDDSEHKVRLNVDCPLVLANQLDRGRLDLKISNHLQLKVPQELGDDPKVELRFQSRHDSKYFSFHVETRGQGQFSDTNGLIVDIAQNAEARIEVRDWNQWLKSLPLRYTVLPAPFNAMNGKLVIDVPQKLDAHNRKEVSVDLDFAGTNQVLSFKVGSQIALDDLIRKHKAGSLTVNLDLRKLALTMPRWHLNDAEPKLLSDSRFVTREKFEKIKAEEALEARGKPAPAPFPLDLKLESDPNEAVRIHSSFLDEDLRLNFAFEILNGSLHTGDLQVLPLTTELFRRKVVVDSFKIHWPSNGDEPVVDGLVKFPLPDYLVKLNVKGAMSQPTIYLESDPALPEDDIYSVLIFGRPLSDLQSDQKDSMAQAQEALTKGFFSLTSLYFFGATPIESIGYDPTTGQVSASFRVSNRNSVQVGGNSSSVNQVTLRRSLGRGWYIQGTVKDDKKTEESFSTSVEKVIKY